MNAFKNINQHLYFRALAIRTFLPSIYIPKPTTTTDSTVVMVVLVAHRNHFRLTNRRLRVRSPGATQGGYSFVTNYLVYFRRSSMTSGPRLVWGEATDSVLTLAVSEQTQLS